MTVPPHGLLDTDPWLTSNPFALASISQASEHRTIVAARDIVDDRGIKLWAANLRVAPTLHQRLIARKLQHPLETSLRVEDGVDNADLLREFEVFLAGGEFLSHFVEPVADAVRDGIHRLHLAPAVQLLLTAAQQNDVDSYRHAVKGMALAGALALRTRAPAAMVTHAFAAGLLHDLGEMYVNPAYQRGGRLLQPAEFRHVVAHPLIGAMLLARLADYPDAVCRAVREHHEKLDGTGYPGQLHQASLSPLGQLLALVELMLGLAHRGEQAPAALSFALRFVPAESNAAWSGPVVRLAETQARAGPQPQQLQVTALRELDAALSVLLLHAQNLAQGRRVDVARVSARAVQRLTRLRRAGDAMGLWQTADLGRLSADEQRDLDLAVAELRHRLCTLQRDCLWPETDPQLHEDAELGSLWLQLQVHLDAPTP